MLPCAAAVATAAGTTCPARAAAPATPDYIERALPLAPGRELRILQAFGALGERSRAAREAGGDEGDRQGAFMWPGSIELAQSMSDQRAPMPDVSGKRVLELGCGTGVAGIAALLAGAASVAMTDGNQELLPTAEKNLARNADAALRERARIGRLRWGNAEDIAAWAGRGPFDLVIAGEVAYERAAISALLGTARAFMLDARAAGRAPLAVLQQTPEISDNGRGLEEILSAARGLGLAADVRQAGGPDLLTQQIRLGLAGDPSPL